MFKKQNVKFAIIAVAAIALFVVISGRDHHAGRMPGDVAGRVSAAETGSVTGSEAVAVSESSRESTRHEMRGGAESRAYGERQGKRHGGFWMIGEIIEGLFKLGLFLLLIALLLKMFGPMIWQRMGGVGEPPWSRFWAYEFAGNRSGTMANYQIGNWGWDEVQQKWHELKQRWGRESDTTEQASEDQDDDRPAEERFVV